MNSFLSRVGMALSLMLSPVAWAEDVDLFVGVPPDQSLLAAPNVLIVLDNTANWNTAFNNEMDALSSVVSGLPVDKFNLGLMLFTETSGGDKGNDGAYVRAAIRRLDADYKGKFTALVDRNNVDGGDAGLHRTNDKSNGGKASKAMWEAYEYFTGGAPHAGNQKVKSDYLGNVSGTVASKAVYGLSGNALNSKGATAYNQPAQNGCVKNFIIYISNGPAQDNTNDIKAATDALIAAGGSATSIPLSPSGSQDMVADEWARFMRNQGVGVITYTVDVDKITSGQGPGWSALLKSMATVSDGKYFDVTSSGNAIADSLKAIFSEIQAVDSSFASVSLPASVNTEGRYLNQIFIGLFRPDGNAKPQWAGNLKQYRVAKIDNALTTADAREPVKSAIGNDGYFDECARSYWTPTSTDNYWAFNSRGACLEVENSNASNSPDGNVVEKGGHAYLLRSSTGRTMKTCSDSGCTALANFTTSIEPQFFGLASTNTTERDAVVNWALGVDNKDENNNKILTEKRPYIHGDIIHSRPVAINYGTDGSPAVVVFYGGNDGLLRAVNGNRTASVGTSPAIPAGGELWSFMPTEFYPHIKRLRDEQPLISFPGQQVDDDPLTPLPKPKHYGMDGSVTAYRDDSNTWLFAGMRRGGRAIYAFDVSNPASPVLKWKKGCPSQSTDDGCTTGMSRIGQTWSTPTVFKAAGYTASGTPKPMLIMGGGYDTVRDHDGDGDLDPPCEDNDPHTCSVTKGNRIYVLDANDGTRLKKFDTERGVIADVTLVRDSTGLVTYGYTADLGGNVYRITMGSNAPADWTMTKIAALGCSDASAACARKFMFAPSVVNEGDFIRVMLGSGDREKPITSYDTATAVDNYFFMLKDKPADSTWITSGNGACGDLTKRICMSSLLEIGADDPTQSALDSKPLGWYLRLSDSEQVVTSAVTGLGKVIFSTHTPAVQQEGVCSSLGLAKSYSISYKDASAPNGERYVLVEGGGLPPSPVIVQVILDDGTEATICISCGKNRFEVQEPFESQVLPVQPKSRVYWNIEQ